MHGARIESSRSRYYRLLNPGVRGEVTKRGKMKGSGRPDFTGPNWIPIRRVEGAQIRERVAGGTSIAATVGGLFSSVDRHPQSARQSVRRCSPYFLHPECAKKHQYEPRPCSWFFFCLFIMYSHVPFLACGRYHTGNRVFRRENEGSIDNDGVRCERCLRSRYVDPCDVVASLARAYRGIYVRILIAANDMPPFAVRRCTKIRVQSTYISRLV